MSGQFNHGLAWSTFDSLRIEFLAAATFPPDEAARMGEVGKVDQVQIRINAMNQGTWPIVLKLANFFRADRRAVDTRLVAQPAKDAGKRKLIKSHEKQGFLISCQRIGFDVNAIRCWLRHGKDGTGPPENERGNFKPGN